MKHNIIILFFILQIITMGCFAQRRSSVFEIVTKKDADKQTTVYYEDIERDKYTEIPKFNLQTSADLSVIVTKEPPVKKLGRIEKEIFSEEELYNQNKVFAIFEIHIPTGKVVAVSFLTKKTDINVRKLELYNRRIKNEIIFDISLRADLTKEGYDRIAYPLFFSSYELKE